ncbi:unnamed protein product [Cuscuta epithymum]|uniref:F-box domain-containing protein n=1 Tax=Cuscuta epithymum TaxID=186058 RepID=A0AAV0DNP3_9ASTE|nr:unnamed protein product [Cuscuta epithymum]
MDLPKPKKTSNRLLLKQKKEVAEDEPKNRFGCLPPEIAKEILSRLPNVKSIFQFRSVCRSLELWSHDSHVFRMHFSRSSSTGLKLLYFYSSNVELHFVEFSDINEEGLIARKIQNAFVDLTPRSFWVHGSSNGIMILQDLHNWNWKCLYNPFTRDYKVVPELDGSSSFSYWWPACHPVTNDCKIFAIRSSYGLVLRSIAYVYCLSRNEWTRLGEFSFEVEGHSQNQGVLVHGRIHCLTLQNKGKGKVSRFLNITSIGIMDYSVKEVPMPAEVIFKNSKRSQLAVLGGCLSVGVRRVDSRMHIWVMKTYEMESSWVKQYVFGAEFFKFDRNWRSRGEEMLQIVCLLNNEEILLAYDGDGQRNFISYNVVTKGYKTLTFGGTLPTKSFRVTIDTCCWSA